MADRYEIENKRPQQHNYSDPDTYMYALAMWGIRQTLLDGIPQIPAGDLPDAETEQPTVEAKTETPEAEQPGAHTDSILAMLTDGTSQLAPPVEPHVQWLIDALNGSEELRRVIDATPELASTLRGLCCVAQDFWKFREAARLLNLEDFKLWVERLRTSAQLLGFYAESYAGVVLNPPTEEVKKETVFGPLVHAGVVN